MFQLGKTIVSEDIIKKDFMCNLSACKGACCVDGDAGAPLDEDEAKILKSIYPIEEAYNQGEISWKKPVSCHLYPIRVQDYSEFSAVSPYTLAIDIK